MSPPLQEWRELTAFLARLNDPSTAPPVEATADFLRQTTFELEVQRVRLRIPDTLSDAPVRPNGDLTLVLRAGADAVRVPLRPTGDPERERQTLVYTFASSGSRALTYRPGDSFFAELSVRKGDRDLKLTWAASRTMSFQFERLLREPRLHAADQSNLEGLRMGDGDDHGGEVPDRPGHGADCAIGEKVAGSANGVTR